MLSFDMTSEDGERTCPLCAEEMDLTDQHLKPCKCGYEICVWCWHHIIDMAEKDETEGRCPACRTPYDKERIVGMAANCERVVTETNSEKKKSHKAKPKTSAEAKKHLSSVRVIQRNLVYIIGLPSNLCDEAVLERKEYFGQYGKVLKVSISRPASAPSQQQLNNNTFSVYITYAREEEAVRCIQSVHNFILEGKSLRACFGTTKYCHAWLRNMTCSNPDCLYLHDVGIQEDSFTKDEIISAYTRSRVPQIASSSSQRRSGYILPPPADDFLCPGNKNLIRSTANGVSNYIKGSPISNAGKSTGLPAAASWGLRAANLRPLAAGTPSSQLNKQKVDSVNNSTLLSSLTESTKKPSAWHDEVVPTSKIPEGKTSTTNMSSSPLVVDNSKQISAWHDEIALTSKGPESRETLQTEYTSHSSESIKLGTSKECSLTGLSSTDIDSDPALRYSAWDDDSVTRSESGEERKSLTLVEESRQLNGRRPYTEKKSQISASHLSSMGVSDAKCTSGLPSSSGLPSLVASAHKDKERSTPVYDICTNSVNNPLTNDLDQPSRVGPAKILEGSNSMEDVAKSLCLNLSTASIDDSYNADQFNGVNHHALGFSTSSAELSETWDSSLPSGCMMDDPLLLDPNDSSEFPNGRLKSLKKDITSEINRMEDPVITSVGQGITHLDIIDQPSSSSFPSNSHVGISNLNSTTISGLGNKKLSSIDANGVIEPCLFLRDNEPAVANGYKQDAVSGFSMPRKVFEFPESNCTEENMGSLERGVNDAGNHSTTATVDTTGESNIISDILSLDFNPWDDSLFSSDNITMLLGESERNEHSFKPSNSSRSQNSNQSRFSFARQETKANITESLLRDKSHPQNLSSLQDVYGIGSQNRPLFDGLEGPNYSAITAPVVSSDKFSGILKPKVSAPPGFSIPNRAPPPGFSSQDRFNRTYEPAFSENHLVAGSIGNSYQAQLTVNSDDVEFIDPAIMAVVKERLPVGICNSGMGLKPTFPTHLSTSDSDPRFQLLMQQSGQPHSNFRVSNQMGDRFLPLNDTYITSQLLSQNQSNLSPFAQMTPSQPRNSHYTNSHWSGWNDIRMNNDMNTNDILRNERLGLNNYYSGNEEPKFHLPGSDVYNRAFGL